MAYRAGSGTSNSGGTSTTQTVNKPIGVAEGDIVVIAIITRGVTTETYTWPTDFTEAARGSITGSVAHDCTYAVATKVATASEPASYTVTQSGARTAGLTCGAWTGRDVSASRLTFATTSGRVSGASSGNINVTGGTATESDDIVWIATLSQAGSAITVTPPGSYSVVSSVSFNTNGDQIYMAYRDAVTAGVTGTISGSWSGGTADTSGMAVAIKILDTTVYDPITSCFPIGYYE